MDLDRLRGSLLEARDERAAALARVRDAFGPRAPMTASSLVVLSLNLPGPDKNLPGAESLVERAMEALHAALPDAQVALQGHDALGPWAAVIGRQPPAAMKLTCVEIEERLRGGRLIDLDVFGFDGGQVDRAAAGLPPRRCLVCDQPAIDCMRLRRHDPSDVATAVRALLS